MPDKRKKNQYNHVFLDAFRNNNALLQQDVADFLGTSRGYISMVEKGDSKLSVQKMDMLFDGAVAKGWDISALVPAYSRLRGVLAYVQKKKSDETGRTISEEEIAREVPFILSDIIEQKIKYGEIGISTTLADAVTKKYPEISRQWLLDGIGPMLITPSEQPSELEKLREEVRLLREAISEYQAETQRTLASLPKLIATEIERIREQSVSTNNDGR